MEGNNFDVEAMFALNCFEKFPDGFFSNAVKKIKCLMNRKFGRKDNSPRISSLCSCFITFVKWGENTGTFKNR